MRVFGGSSGGSGDIPRQLRLELLALLLGNDPAWTSEQTLCVSIEQYPLDLEIICSMMIFSAVVAEDTDLFA